jgi:hypothetical protein
VRPMLRWRTRRAPGYLAVLCERRIGRAVIAATRVRVRTPSGPRTHVLALTDGVLWWIEVSVWRSRLGAIIAWRALNDLVVHSAPRLGLGRGHVLELSSPSTGELLVGTVRGPGADRLLGQLAAEQFARTQANSPAPPEQP